MSEELKPCPFCGSAAMVYPDGDMEGHSIMCSGRGALFGGRVNDCPLVTFGYASHEEAIAAWNRRPEGQAPAAPPSIPRETDAPTKEQALRDLAIIEDIWEMAPDLPYTKRLRLFIEAASAAPPSGVQAIKDALHWLESALKCDEFQWDGDQHEYAAAALLQARAAISAAPPVAPAPAREGWQWVPKEPTEAMLQAVAHKPHPNRPDGWNKYHADQYVRMLAAAPADQPSDKE